MRVAEKRRPSWRRLAHTAEWPHERQIGGATQLRIASLSANPSSWHFPSFPPQKVFSSLVTRSLESMGPRDQNMFKKIFLAFDAAGHTLCNRSATDQGGPMPYPAGHRQEVKR